MVLVTAFMFNLFCSLVPCEPNFGDPVPVSLSSNKAIRSPRNFHSTYGEVPQNPVIFTKSGGVEGYSMKIINGRQIYAFEGIPYAESPSGDLMFQNPVPKAPWEGILPAKKTGPICFQFHLVKVTRITGEMDCLSLNIYSPKIPTTNNRDPKLPVFIWIHGGGAWYGSGSESGPSYLLQEDVIMVSINYRLGILGFLSSGDEEAPGNYGLKDQAVAIKWVSENIQYFGGDPSRIVLMGISSGGVFAHLHMMSPLTKHLISGVIALSGSAMNHWAVSPPEKVHRLKIKLGKELNCPTDLGSKIFMGCVRAVSPYKLIQAQRRLFDYWVFPVIIYHAVVEPQGPGAFLTDTPINLYARNEVARLPLICSQATEEADSVLSLYRNTGTFNYLLRNWTGISADVLDYRYITRNVTETAMTVNQYYLNSTTARPTITQSIDMLSDRFFRVGIHRSLQYHSQIAPTYGMRFGFRSEIGFTTVWGLDPLEYGVGHGTDSGFYFNSSAYFRPLKMGTTSYDVSRMMINIFANFAYDGEPLLQYQNGRSARLWKPVTNPLDVKYLLIDNQNVINIPEPRADAIEFWENLGLWEQVTSPNPFTTSIRAWYPNPNLKFRTYQIDQNDI